MRRSIMKKEKPCLECKQIFAYQKKNKRFCSLLCQQRAKKAETFIETPDMVTCQICQLKAHDIMSHIKRIHKISQEDYQKLYNSPTRSEKYLKGQSERIKGDKNPAWQHGGRFSSLSDKFVHASTTNKQEVIGKIAKSLKENGNCDMTLVYWIKQGFSTEEAKLKQKERQTTFSKEICIQKYGEVEGTKRWVERQEKWIKNYKKSNFSKISQELFWKIYEKLQNKDGVYFATLNNGQLDSSGANNEFNLKLSQSAIKPDFYSEDNKKIIEFDGTYWHGEKRGNQQRDKNRDNTLIQEGFKILHVSEKDFKQNPDKTIQDCIDFING